MFGLSDNDDKKNDNPADSNVTAPAVGSAIDAGVMPVDVGTGPIMPADPLAPPPVDNSVPGPTLPPANQPNPIEAIPSLPVAQTKSAPPTAEATMPDIGAPADADLQNAFMMPALNTGEPEAKDKKKKDKHHSDDDSASDLGFSTSASGGDGANGPLIQLKKQALESLAPLVDKLDQTPEEKFKTTMMLIQASDNSELVPEAYEAANQITDEKVRAQALLDVVNEINYFTQSHEDGKSEE